MSKGLNYDLVINDDDCQELGKKYFETSENLEVYFNLYSEILNRVASEGIKSGKVHENLLRFIEAIEILKNQGKDLGINAEKCAYDFLRDMDSADSYLY